jgi:hypothetical protein
MLGALWLLGAALCFGLGIDIGRARERRKARERTGRVQTRPQPVIPTGPPREPPSDLFREMVLGEDGKPLVYDPHPENPLPLMMDDQPSTVAPPKRARGR